MTTHRRFPSRRDVSSLWYTLGIGFLGTSVLGTGSLGGEGFGLSGLGLGSHSRALAADHTPPPAADQDLLTASWENILAAARGQEVYWNAWGGMRQFNDFMEQAAEEVERDFEVTVKLVRLGSTSEAVNRIVAEAQAGKTSGGSVDVIWINGENFAQLQQRQLLWGPFVERIPHSALLDPALENLTTFDATTPTNGFEAPWGRAHLTFYANRLVVPTPPSSPSDFLTYAKMNPNRLSYPVPSDFVGRTFLTQILLTLTTDKTPFFSDLNSSLNSGLNSGLSDAAQTDRLNPLWEYLNNLHPFLWRQGKDFLATHTAMISMVDNNELAIGMSFNVGDAVLLPKKGMLPPTTYGFFWQTGVIGNVNFLAIPFNSSAKAGAMVLINHLMSPPLQARRQDPNVWGELTVLNTQTLTDAQRQSFASVPTLPTQTFQDIHPSWSRAIENGWLSRYNA